MTERQERVLAFYLPQYHPVSENDEWWGRGFTDWRNVVQTRPRFRGHLQPQIPADLGFYDLRLPETRVAQAELARRSGVDGFCYYHYWFNGSILLGQPLNGVLSSGTPEFPFCLCWANENWTRAWDGLDRLVLIRQQYTHEDADAHILWFLDVFKDKRYVRVDGRPLLLIYRPDQIPEPMAMIRLWRGRTREAGFRGLYLCAVKNGFVDMPDQALMEQGYDAVVDFQPNRRDFPAPKGLPQQVYRLAQRILPDRLYQRLKLSGSGSKVVDYDAMVAAIKKKPWPTSYRKLPCVFPSWDNTPRRRTATIIQNDDPAVYQDWLEHELRRVRSHPSEERLVFINAWNEWAEGCHLEPDLTCGHSFLDATRLARERSYAS
jgi:lipopolysaccharide biosynthesis protein